MSKARLKQVSPAPAESRARLAASGTVEVPVRELPGEGGGERTWERAAKQVPFEETARPVPTQPTDLVKRTVHVLKFRSMVEGNSIPNVKGHPPEELVTVVGRVLRPIALE